MAGTESTIEKGNTAAVDVSDGQSITVVGAVSGNIATVSDDDTEDDEENETQRHENPDEYGDDGDLDGVESWLTGWMAGQLGDGAIQLSEGEYELAREYIGEEYRDRLGQYVEVAGETDGESYDDTFRDARNEQEQLGDQAENFRETKEEYEEAVEDGDTERARELARELEEIAEEIDATSETLRDHYEEIEDQTGEDLSDADEAIEELNQEIQSERADILSTEFVETDLVVEADEETISFLDPLTATGQLQTVEGDPISDEPVRLMVGNDTIQTETDADGTFTFEYRPTDTPLSTSSLSVRYVPDDYSEYLGSEASVDVTIEQVEPKIEELSAPDEVAYGDTVTVSGDLTVEDVPVDGVPLDVVVDGQQIGTVHVSDGSFDGTVDIPASISDGERSLAVRLAYEDRALAGVSETRTVQVQETNTTLSVTATQVGEREVLVTGTLETVNGDGVGGEPVQVGIAGSTVATVTTTGDGDFEETVTVPDSAEYGEHLVSVSYQGSGSNLGPADAETRAEIEPMDGGEDGSHSSDDESGLLGSVVGDDGTFSFDPSNPADSVVGDDGLPTWVWLALSIGVVGIVALLWWARRRPSEAIPYSDHVPVPSILKSIRRITGTPEGASEQSTGGTISSETDEDQEAEPSPTVSLLQHASEHLQAGQPDVAVQACYSAVRQDLESRIDVTGAPTHWEFYQKYRQTNDPDSTADDPSVAALREVTEEYERAVFSVEYVSIDEARTVLERARTLCQNEDSNLQTESQAVADD